MSDLRKFMFDTHDFSLPRAHAGLKTYSEEELRQAQNQSFALGKIDGMKKARQQQEEQISELLQKTLQLTEKLAQAEARRETEKSIEAAQLALRVTQKLLPRFALQYAVHEIEHVISGALGDRSEEPKVAVTVPPAHLESLKTRMDAIAAEKAYAGKIALQADPSLPLTDCRVEWAEGGAERVFAHLCAQIEEKFAKAVSSLEAGLA